MMSDAQAEATRQNILIVDDAPANLRLLSQILSEAGYAVRAVTSGERALESVHAALPDLILLDIRMPGMNGYAVCKHLKADPDTRSIPIIFISALDEVRDKVEAFAVGGVDYVTKPFQGEEVLARVKTHLALRRLQTQLRDANTRLQDANMRMERELALAGQVQASFLPREVVQTTGWEVVAALRPARQTSGDFYDIIPLPNGRLGLLIADVVDKGVGAALFMALSWILIRTYAVEHPTQPELVLSAVNQRVLAETDTGQFVTAFYGILDPATGTLTYCNAGHPPPFLFSAQQGDMAQPLSKTGMALGVIETETWGQAIAQLDPGDALVLYSDGVTDAENAQQASFGRERLKAKVRADRRRSAQEIQDALLTEIQAFVGEATQSDDIALMIVLRVS
jgi:sigma-B regulation protein RsbU (phosphoserine phosphatase)